MTTSEELKWKPMDRDLKKGEVIRVKTGNPANRPQYIYGKPVSGFGMSMKTIGSAIFVDNESYSYEDTRDDKSSDRARWERYWGIEILADNGA